MHPPPCRTVGSELDPHLLQHTPSPVGRYQDNRHLSALRAGGRRREQKLQTQRQRLVRCGLQRLVSAKLLPVLQDAEGSQLQEVRSIEAESNAWASGRGENAVHVGTGVVVRG